MTMFENIYISIMNDNIGSIADWFDSNNEEEKRIIEELIISQKMNHQYSSEHHQYQ